MGNSPCRTYLYLALAHLVVGPPFQVQNMCRQTVLLRGQHYEVGRTMALIHVLYIILEHVSFNIMFCIKSDVITLGGLGYIDCIYMDKWALRGHFYSYVDPVWSSYNIGTGCHKIAQIVFWVELLVQRRLCPIFVKSLVLGKGDSMEWCRVTRHPQIFRGGYMLSTDPRYLGCHTRHVSDKCFSTPASATTLLLRGQTRLYSVPYRTFGYLLCCVPLIQCYRSMQVNTYMLCIRII